MHWLKISLISITGIFLLAVIAIVGYILILDQNDYKRLIIQNVSKFTDTTLTINGLVDIDISSSPTLTISQFKLKDNTDRFFFNVQTLKLQIDLKALLSKSFIVENLVIEDATIIISNTATSGNTPPTESTSYFYPILKKSELKNIKIQYRNPGTTDEINAFLKIITVKAPAVDMPIRIEGKALIENNQIEISGEFGAIQNTVLAGQAYPLSLKIAHGRDTVSINGKINNILNGQGVKIQIDVVSPDTSILSKYWALLPQLQGQLEAHTLLEGDFPTLSVNNIDVRASYKDTISLQATGLVTDILNQQNLNIDFSGFINDEKLLTKYLPEGIPRISRLKTSAKISSTDDIYYVDKLSLQGSNNQGFDFDVQGSTGLHFNKLQHPFPQLNLTVDFESKTTRELKYFVFNDVPELGTVKGKIHLLSLPKKNPGIDELTIQIDSPKLSLGIKGKIEDMPLGADMPISGINLEIELQSQTTTPLASILDYPLPEVRAIEMKGQFKGSILDSTFKLHDLDLKTKEGIFLNAKGKLRFGDLSKASPIKSTTIQLAASSPGTAVIGSLLKTSLPELGPVNGTAQLFGSGNKFSLKNIDVTVGQNDKLLISATGDIRTILFTPLTSAQDIDILLTAKTHSIKMLEPVIGNPLPDLGQFDLSILLQGSSNKLDLTDIKLELGSDEVLSYQATGEIKELNLNTSFELNTKLSIPKLSVLGEKLGQELPDVGPLAAKGKLSGNKKSGTFTGIAKLANTKIHSDLTFSNTGERPSIKGTISSPVIHLADLGLKTIKENNNNIEAEKKLTKEKKTEKPKSPLFSRDPFNLEKMKNIDLAIELDIDKIKGTQFSIDDVIIKGALNNGHLIIGPASIKFEKGSLTFETEITTHNEPTISAKIVVANMDFSSIVKEITEKIPFEGTANFHIDFDSHGISYHELAKNLNGETSLIIENAEILQRHLDLLVVDLIGWALTSTIKSNDRTKIDCTIVHFNIENGKIQSETLFATGPSLSLKGEATLDLGLETIDMTLLPENKQKLWSKTTPIMIRGPILNPAISSSPYASVAIESAGYVLIPYFYVPLRIFEYTKALTVNDNSEQQERPCLSVTLPSGQKE